MTQRLTARRTRRPLSLLPLAALGLVLAQPALAQVARTERVPEAELRADVDQLASDAFEGRAPGTPGEARTIAHIVAALAKAGFEPGVLPANGAGPTARADWLHPVPLMQMGPGVATLTVGGASLAGDDLLLFSDRPMTSLTAVPVLNAGHGWDAAGLAQAKVAGQLVLIDGGRPPAGRTPLDVRAQTEALLKAGALGVVTIAPDGTDFAQVRGQLARRLAPDPGTRTGAVRGLMSRAAAARLLGADHAARAGAADFQPRVLDGRADLTLASDVRAFASHNIVGKLPGARPDGRAVVLLGHWDHLGICRPEGAADRICNGAVDNASGIAALLAVARRLGQGKRPDRDIYIMATTAEESGLLGAYRFVADAVVPPDNIAVALNIDTIAIAPRGAPVAIVGQGNPDYDGIVHEAARALGRSIDMDGEANAFIRRQDGWALAQRGIPTLMAGGSFSDMKPLEAYLAGPYHSPADQPSDTVPLGGAAEDADLHLYLARRFADRRWTPPARAVPVTPPGTSATTPAR